MRQFCSIRPHSHRVKAKKIKEQLEEIKENFQTSKKIFTFARCERILIFPFQAVTVFISIFQNLNVSYILPLIGLGKALQPVPIRIQCSQYHPSINLEKGQCLSAGNKNELFLSCPNSGVIEVQKSLRCYNVHFNILNINHKNYSIKYYSNFLKI